MNKTRCKRGSLIDLKLESCDDGNAELQLSKKANFLVVFVIFVSEYRSANIYFVLLRQNRDRAAILFVCFKALTSRGEIEGEK
jgi:hypothetical protein